MTYDATERAAAPTAGERRRALLLDVDGVLVNSAASTRRAWEEWALGQGIEDANPFVLSHGMTAVEKISMYAPQLDARAEAVRLSAIEAADASDVTALPGAATLLAHDRVVLVSGARRDVVLARLQAARLATNHPLVSAESVTRGKPSAQPYSAAAVLAETDPSRCLAFEDSPLGIKSARDAEIGLIVGLTTTARADELLDADVITRDLDAWASQAAWFSPALLGSGRPHPAVPDSARPHPDQMHCRGRDREAAPLQGRVGIVLRLREWGNGSPVCARSCAVLTVRKIRVGVGDLQGALAAARYPLEAADSPSAFARDGEEGGGGPCAMWLGSEHALGLIGLERGAEVAVEQLTLALQGRHAKTGTQVRWPGSVKAVHPDRTAKLDDAGQEYREQVVNNFDVTFSAPKSVSVAWAVAGPERRRQIERAMMIAANGTLEHLTSTRSVVGGNAPAHGFAASMALHVTARTARGEAVPSPQLHVHAHLVGVVDEKGELRTPNSAALYRNGAMLEGGAVGRALLAQEMRALGFQIRAQTGRGGLYFELEGISAALCDRWSGRTRDVMAWVKQHAGRGGGRLSSQERAQAAALTRARKSAMEGSEIATYWIADQQECAFGEAELEGVAAAPAAPARDPGELCEEARAAMLAYLWAEGPTVSVGALHAKAYALVPAGVSYGQIEELLAGMYARGELIALDKQQVTSGEIRAREQYVVRAAASASQRRGAGLSASAVQQGIAVAEAGLGGHALQDKQAEAVELFTSGRGWACLTGRAGTGKGPVLEAVAHAYRQDGWQVIACAVDNATRARLGRQIGAPGLTIHTLLRRTEELAVNDRTVIVIDEASKVGLRDWVSLAGLALRTRARVFPVGDVGQVGAIECAGMLDMMLRSADVETVELTEVLRPRDPDNPERLHPWMAGYQAMVYDGDAHKAIEKLREHGAFTMHDTREDAMVGIVEGWERRRHERDIRVEDSILIVHGSNDDVDRVNALAQQRRIDAGEIGGESVAAVDRGYRLYAGDVVMLRDAAYQPEPGVLGGRPPERVENGTMGTITAVDAARDRVTVDFDTPEGDRRSVAIDLAKLRALHAPAPDLDAQPRRPGQFDRVAALWLCYAAHPFPIVGANFKLVGSLWGHWTQTKENTCGGDFRATRELYVHTDRESAGPDGARIAKRLSKARHRKASITYDEIDTHPAFEKAPTSARFPRIPSHGPTVEQPGAPQVVGSLGAYRLGRKRLAQVSRLAAAAKEEIASLDDRTLHAEHEQGRRALELLNADLATAVQVNERSQQTLAGRIDRARERAADLEAQAHERSGLRARAERRGLREAAGFERQAVARDQATLDRLAVQERELRSTGQHPDDWLRRHGAVLARAIAAADQLALRQQERARETDHALAMG